VAAQIARGLPGASVRLTKATAEIDDWLRVLPETRAVLAAGGDGTAIALMNALARVVPPRKPFPTVGVLPLGTGNGWAHALGAPKLHRCIELLSAASRRSRTTGVATAPDHLPTRRCGLLEVEGVLAHFAGSGWDAMILDDYKRQLEVTRGAGGRLSKSVYGYLLATLVRTAPRVVVKGNPRLLIENLGDDVFVVDDHGSPRLIPGARCGTVLYDGPAGAASAGTCPQFGYRFRAFPFAERMPGYISVRVYDRKALGALASIPLLWKGAHPLVGMHDWLATSVRMTFSRPVPLQIGGDAHGMRRTIEFRSADRDVRMVDWRRLLCSAEG
jgi:diacylglycerol kinase family enzyme